MSAGAGFVNDDIPEINMPVILACDWLPEHVVLGCIAYLHGIVVTDFKYQSVMKEARKLWKNGKVKR